jgi:hypothetical protein
MKKMSNNLIMVDHAHKDSRSVSVMLRRAANGKVLTCKFLEDTHPIVSQKKLTEKFRIEERDGYIFIKNQYSVSILKKQSMPILGAAAWLALSAIWCAICIFASILAGFIFAIKKLLSATQSISKLSVDVSGNDDEDDDYKSTSGVFYQTSASDNTVWTDYSEHIHNL